MKRTFTMVVRIRSIIPSITRQMNLTHFHENTNILKKIIIIVKCIVLSSMSAFVT